MNAVTDSLFAPPAWGPPALLLVGVAAVLVGLMRGQTQVRNAGLAVAAAAGVWLLVAWYVETDLEFAGRHARDVVDAYDEADWDAMAALIEPTTRLDNIAGDALVTAARLTHASVRHESLDVRGLEAERDLAGIRVRFNVTSYQGTGVSRLTTAWQFDYNRRGDRVVLDRVEPLSTPVIDADAIRGRIVR